MQHAVMNFFSKLVLFSKWVKIPLKNRIAVASYLADKFGVNLIAARRSAINAHFWRILKSSPDISADDAFTALAILTHHRKLNKKPAYHINGHGKNNVPVRRMSSYIEIVKKNKIRSTWCFRVPMLEECFTSWRNRFKRSVTTYLLIFDNCLKKNGNRPLWRKCESTKTCY